MKNNRKALLLVLCAVMMITASIFGTLAYLTDTKTATNTFTVGSVTITLDETDTDNDTNTEDNVTVNNVVRDTANEYHLLPGKDYKKDPIVHLAATNDDCYVFVKVENGLAVIEAEDYTNIETQITNNKWNKLTGVDNVYWQLSKVPAEGAPARDLDLEVFREFKIAGTVDNDTLAECKDAKIIITAYAIQAQGFNDAAAAWAAGNVTEAKGGWVKESTNP